MNILHLSTPLSWRGGEQQIAYLTAEIAKRNIKQIVVCPIGSEMEKFCIANSLEYFTFKKRLSFDILFARQLKKLCSDHNISILHAHDPTAQLYAVLSAAFWGNKTPVLLNRRVDFPVKSNFFSHFKYNHSCIKKIICDSETIKAVLAPSIKDKSKLITIHSGIDPSRFINCESKNKLHTEFNISKEEIIIGNVAAVAPHKDYYTFVDTAKILLDGGLKCKFIIIGDGPERSNIENYIKSKKLENDIFITGFRNDIPDILPELDVFLITSETEGLGTSIIEAFACKVPVVATAAGGIPEIVKHGKTGLLAPVKNSEELAKNVLQILNDKNLREHLISEALLVPPLFAKETIGEKTINVYGTF